MALIRNTKRREKILDNGFQSNCSTRAKVWTNPSYIEKRAEIRHRSVMLPALQLLLYDYLPVSRLLFLIFILVIIVCLSRSGDQVMHVKSPNYY